MCVILVLFPDWERMSDSSSASITSVNREIMLITSENKKPDIHFELFDYLYIVRIVG